MAQKPEFEPEQPQRQLADTTRADLDAPEAGESANIIKQQQQQHHHRQVYDHNRNLVPASSGSASGSGADDCETAGCFGIHSTASASPLQETITKTTTTSSQSDSSDTNPTSCSTRRMSQASLVALSEIGNDDNDDDSRGNRCTNTGRDHEQGSDCQLNLQRASLIYDEPQDQCHRIRQCSKQDQVDEHERQQQLASYDHLLNASYAVSEAEPLSDDEQQVVVRIHDGDYCDDVLRRPSIKMSGAGAERPASELNLVKLLGRRVSALPHLFSSSPLSNQARKRARSRNLNSLSEASGPTTRSGLDRRYTLHDTLYLKRSDEDELQPPPTTVVGVGGTVTTVSKGHRKTAPLPRLVAKNGNVNLFLDNIDRRQFMRDLFTTMIDIKWRYNLLAASLGFVFSWLLFACIWYTILYVHGDLDPESEKSKAPCIVNVNTFPAALLFSIETQSTLGFGSRFISVECPSAIVIFCFQLIFGVVVECLIVGMVFAKLSRPAKRSQTIMFSKMATISLREGKMCLQFRVGDVRSKSHIIGATIKASLVSQKITLEGETIPFHHNQLDVRIDDSINCLLLIWPVIIVHQIDEYSPFYKLNPDELANFKFEIITVLEGTVESTGQSIQVRSSYLPSEVKWGYRFEPIVSTHGNGRYAQTIIDYNKFNKVTEVDTPRCSPVEYYNRQSVCNGNPDHLKQQ